MRLKSLAAALFGLMSIGVASSTPASAFHWDRPDQPAGWSHSRTVRHWVYYPRYNHVYLRSGYTDPLRLSLRAARLLSLLQFELLAPRLCEAPSLSPAQVLPGLGRTRARLSPRRMAPPSLRWPSSRQLVSDHPSKNARAGSTTPRLSPYVLPFRPHSCGLQQFLLLREERGISHLGVQLCRARGFSRELFMLSKIHHRADGARHGFRLHGVVGARCASPGRTRHRAWRCRRHHRPGHRRVHRAFPAPLLLALR